MILLSMVLTALLVTDTVSTFHLNGGKNYGNSTTNDHRVNDDSWENDPFVAEANAQCSAGEAFACWKSSAVESIGSLFKKSSYPVVREARFIRTKPYTKERLFPEIVHSGNDTAESGRQSINVWSSAVNFLLRRAETFLKTTVFEVDLTKDLTGGGEYAPRFLDEIYTEIDALEDKNDKPNKRYEFKKLFIPLLFILKLFKVKLLVLMPIIFGLVSFKKVLAFLAIIVPGIIGYYKVCKPDLGQSYGSYGHSSYYNGPPSSIRQKIHTDPDYGDAVTQGNLPYRGYRRYMTVDP